VSFESELRALESRVFRLPVASLEGRVARLEQGLGQAGAPRAAGAFTVTFVVTVVDAGTGLPVDSGTVELLDGAGGSLTNGTTDASGVVTLVWSTPHFSAVYVVRYYGDSSAGPYTQATHPLGLVVAGATVADTFAAWPGVVPGGGTPCAGFGSFALEQVITATTASWGGATFDLTWDAGAAQWKGCFTGTVAGVSSPVRYALTQNFFGAGGLFVQFLTNPGHTAAVAGTCASGVGTAWLPAETLTHVVNTCVPFNATLTTTSTQFPYSSAVETITVVNKHGG
jgi:hypothetical protein